MSENISREEMMTMIEVMSKNNQYLENIANSFRTTCEELKEINNRLHNGITKDIANEVKEDMSICFKDVTREHRELTTLSMEIKKDTSNTKLDVNFAKWLIGISGLVIIIATVVIRGLDNRLFLTNSIDKQVKSTIEEEFKTINRGLIKNE